jgi:hypothetical protein
MKASRFSDGGAKPDNMSQCIVRNEGKYITQCMRAPLGED